MILLTAFSGQTNSSKILLNQIDTKYAKKLLLTNSFATSKKQMLQEIEGLQPDTIISFGQKPKTEMIHIETKATMNDDDLVTTYNINILTSSLNENNIKYTISDNAGNYLCNHVYYYGLHYIKKTLKNTTMIFIHVPNMKNFIQFDAVRNWLEKLCHR